MAGSALESSLAEESSLDDELSLDEESSLEEELSLDDDPDESSKARASGALPVVEHALITSASPASRASMWFRLKVCTTGVLCKSSFICNRHAQLGRQ